MMLKGLVFFNCLFLSYSVANWYPQGDYEYFISHSSEKFVNFKRASKICKEKQATLVTIGNGKTQEFLKSKIETLKNDSKVGRSYYIGLKHKGARNSTRYEWSDGTVSEGYSNWGSSKKSNHLQTQCVVLYIKSNYAWRDVACDLPRRYICQRQIQNSTNTSSVAVASSPNFGNYTSTSSPRPPSSAITGTSPVAATSISNVENYTSTSSPTPTIASVSNKSSVIKEVASVPKVAKKTNNISSTTQGYVGVASSTSSVVLTSPLEETKNLTDISSTTQGPGFPSGVIAVIIVVAIGAIIMFGIITIALVRHRQRSGRGNITSHDKAKTVEISADSTNSPV